jgi:FKBP-type peptidyl-prolyl cis-trans isomerase FklB
LSYDFKEIGMKTVSLNALKQLRKVVLPTVLLLFSTHGIAQSDIDLADEDNRIGYSIGANIGQNLLDQQILEDVDVDSFVIGMLDAFGGDLKLSSEEMIAAIQSFQQRAQARAASAMLESLAASEEFLSQNAQKDGVVSLDSGLQYLILESGQSDGASPALSDSVLAHYHGTLSDGSVFDSSVERGEPAQFGLSQVIAGWTEALQLMKVGDKWRLFIPPAMAYGEASPTPAIPPNSALIFDVELLEIR